MLVFLNSNRRSGTEKFLERTLEDKIFSQQETILILIKYYKNGIDFRSLCNRVYIVNSPRFWFAIFSGVFKGQKIMSFLYWSNMIAFLLFPFHEHIFNIRNGYLKKSIIMLCYYKFLALLSQSSNVKMIYVSYSAMLLHQNFGFKSGNVIGNYYDFGDEELILNQPDGSLIIGVNSRFADGKNFGSLIALKDLKISFEVWIIGLNVYEKAQEIYSELHEIREHLKLFRHTKDVSEWYNKIDLLIHPSGYEGFPNVIFEAIANGKLVIYNQNLDKRYLLPASLSFNFNEKWVERLSEDLEKCNLRITKDELLLLKKNYSKKIIKQKYSKLCVG